MNRFVGKQRTRSLSSGVVGKRGKAIRRGALWLLPLAFGSLPFIAVVRVAAAPSVTLYRGEPTIGTNIQLAGWGNGTATDTSAEAFSGSHSIKLNTDGYYAGGRLIFHEPVDIKSALPDFEKDDRETQKNRLQELAATLRERVQRTLDRETENHALARFAKLIKRRS